MTQNTSYAQFENGPGLIATFHHAQKAPIILRRQPHTEKGLSSSLGDNLPEPENYGELEQLMFSCLQSGDDKSALLCIEQLSSRFGVFDAKVAGLRGLFEEATAESEPSLEECLQKYDLAISENPVNLPILKRRIALLNSLSRPMEAISNLNKLLEAVPTDAEAWCELAYLYRSQGMSPQAVYCLEEALLIVPYAWNIHALLGETLFSSALLSDLNESCQLLERSIRYFCRSVELCTDYLRGFYGLLMATSLLGEKRLQNHSKDHLSPQRSSSWTSTNFTLDELTLFARKRLDDIVRHRSSHYQLWKGDQGDLIAAKELLRGIDSS
ncbi:tetratricopeptide repeat domain protein [Aspergillus heteromorphus CBS 117.55]|uniref:ER membrane protein complex subunit 2 n=1 Tax=Aspergillus heteromorphus CBS 117.55 TaxID=1448321 RepID=A0A317UR38_9EURO|nr:tetratricopeptide repeat domain protein [Aspergillus heteromorphus CBS 117.55]PWY63558.1 tetratricopeptide repeat domain protein [Aspergillus heteromorphus CBS 117.55]